MKSDTNKKIDHNYLDAQIISWWSRHGIKILRIGLGIVFIWFGLLKFFPGLSPAENLVARTIPILTFSLVSPSVGLPLLAIWECAIGLGLIAKRFLRLTLLLLFGQLLGAMSPLLVLPSMTWQHFPYAPTLVGQYIIKDIVLIGAGLVIGATARGGELIADSKSAQHAKKEQATRNRFRRRFGEEPQ